MPSQNYNENPQGVAAVWREFHRLQKELRDEIEKFRKEVNKQRLRSLIWAERAWLIPLLFALASALFGGMWYIGGLVVDSHIQKAAVPINKKLDSAVSDISEIKGTLSVVQAQFALQKYSSVSPNELRSHASELKQVQASLASAQDSAAVNFWPTAFQTLSLVSQASSSVDFVKLMNAPESSLDNVSTNAPGRAMSPLNHQNVVLKNLVQGIVIENSVVRFDESVRLVNDLFINCVFILPSEANPPQKLQNIGKALLEADLSRVILNAS